MHNEDSIDGDTVHVEVGDIVIVETSSGPRPAIVTVVWNNDCVNVVLFKDGTYDQGVYDSEGSTECMTSLLHQSTVPPNSVLTWRLKSEAYLNTPVG